MSLVAGLNAWGSAWAGFMVRALIDATALLGLVLLIWLPLRRRISAHFAHGLFLLVLVKLVVPVPADWSVWTAGRALWRGAVRVAIEAPREPVARPEDEAPILIATPDPEPIIAGAVPPAPRGQVAGRGDRGERAATVAARARPRLSTEAALMLAWAGVTGVLLVRLIAAVAGTRRLLREALPIEPGADWLPVDLEALRRAAGVRGRVRWAVSPVLSSPAVGGLLRPTVVMPPDLEDELTPKQLGWVLLHELAHIRRGDLWVVVGQRLVQTAFFFHPAVHAANWLIDQLREYACDDAALAAAQASRADCGEGFLSVVGRAAEPQAPALTAALGLFESRMLIRRRLMRILDGRRRVDARLSLKGLAALLLLGAVVLPAGRAHVAPASVEAPRLGPDDEPRLFAPAATYLHDDREATAGAPRSAVLAVACSPDGRTLASAGEDGGIILRDTRTGTVRASLAGHGETVTSLAFRPDGLVLASGGYDGRVRLWDVAAGEARGVWAGHDGWVYGVAFSRDGRLLASAGVDKTVRVRDAGSGAERAVLTGHEAAVRAVAFGPDGTWLASAGADGVAIVWDVAAGVMRRRLAGHGGTIRAVAVAPDGRALATAGEDGEIRLWDARTGAARATLTGHGDMVLGLAFSPAGATLASGGLDATIRLWDPRTGRERAVLTGHGEGVAALAFGPGARPIVSAGYDGTVRTWEAAAPTLSAAATLEQPDEVWAVAFGRGGKVLYADGKNEAVAVIDPAAALPVDRSMKGGGKALAVSPDGSLIAAGGWDRRVRLFDSESRGQVVVLEGHRDGVLTAAFRPDGKVLATGSQDGEVRLWDVARRALVKTLPARSRPVTAVRFSPDGRTLAVATGDWKRREPGAVELIDGETGDVRGTLRGHTLEVATLDFSPDGRSLATSGADGVVKLWDTTTLAERASWPHADCKALAFSPDGRLLATGHWGGDVVLWDADGGRKVATLKGHGDLVFAVAFSPDGKMLATGAKDRTVRLWNLAARRLAARTSLQGELACVGPVAVSPDGRTIAVAEPGSEAPGDILLWDVATRRVRATLVGHDRGVASLAFSPDGAVLASSSWDLTVRTWDPVAAEPAGEPMPTDAVVRLAFSPDGRTLALAGQDRVLTLRDAFDGAELARFDGFRGPLYAVAFSADGQTVAAGGGRTNVEEPFGEVKLLDAYSLDELADLDGHTEPVLSLAFSADGSTLASGGVDSTVRLWDVEGGTARLSLGGFPDCVRALGISPDGRALAVAGRGDGVVSLLDAGSGGELARLVGHRRPVLGLSFAPDGRTLATGSLDSTVKLWDVPAAGARAGR